MHVFYDFFYSEINSVYYFYQEMNIFTFAQICSGFLVILTSFFFNYLLLQVFRCINQKLFSLVFQTQKRGKSIHESQKIWCAPRASGPFDLVWLQCSSAACKTHSPSVRACSPSTRTVNSNLSLKRPTLRPRYAIYYFFCPLPAARCI